MKALGHKVSKKKIFFCFSNCKSKGAIDTPPPQGHAWRNLCKALAVVVSEKKIFSCIFHCKPMADKDASRAGPVWTPGPRLAGFIKRTTIHCYIQNMKALGLVVSEKKIFFKVLPMTPPGRGPCGPQGHGWQDLYREPLYIATQKI